MHNSTLLIFTNIYFGRFENVWSLSYLQSDWWQTDLWQPTWLKPPEEEALPCPFRRCRVAAKRASIVWQPMWLKPLVDQELQLPVRRCHVAVKRAWMASAIHTDDTFNVTQIQVLIYMYIVISNFMNSMCLAFQTWDAHELDRLP